MSSVTVSISKQGNSGLSETVNRMAIKSAIQVLFDFPVKADHRSLIYADEMQVQLEETCWSPVDNHL